LDLTQLDFSNRRILVTGGTGFIGGRLVERLTVEYNARVRVLVRNFIAACRIARCPVEMVCGDVTSVEDVVRAVQDCDVVVHCAYGNAGDTAARRLVNLEGTRTVLEAARQAGCKRVVHLSTVQVYGPLTHGDLDETAPRRYFGDHYSDSKLDAENLALEYCQKYGLPVTVIQPTVVYGPFATTWTSFILERLKTSRQILVNGGDGLCNAVYIDDLVSAILLAIVREDAVGEALLISGAQPVTWKEFYGSYEQMLGEVSTISMSAEAADALTAKTKRRRSILQESISVLREQVDVRQRLLNTMEGVLLYKAANFFLPTAIRKRLTSNGHAMTLEKPIRPLAYPLDAKFYSTKTRVRIDKAKRLLGYRPLFDLKSGMAVTEAWCRWANLIGDASRTL